jgi:hypothetical protein
MKSDKETVEKATCLRLDGIPWPDVQRRLALEHLPIGTLVTSKKKHRDSAGVDSISSRRRSPRS